MSHSPDSRGGLDSSPSNLQNSAPRTKGKRTTSPSQHQKPCSRCHTYRDVLVRCQTSVDGEWQFVCPGKCWKEVSGGVIDGDGKDEHQGYRYGGMWKNKWAGVSAKKKNNKKKKKDPKAEERENDDEQLADGEASLQTSQNVERDSGVPEWQGDSGEDQAHEHKYTRNDRVRLDGKVWTCRRSHVGAGAKEERKPGTGYRFWKEVD